MDRNTVYFGEVPRETDFLLAQQNAMVGLARLSATVLGTSTIVDAFTVTPTTPGSLNVLLTPGTIYQMENLEGSPWSSIPADTAHSIMKQGILLDPIPFGITPPGTIGYSQVFLISAQYQDLDTGSLTLPYYNAANPQQQFFGPGNAGTAQNTVRKGSVATQIKAGIAAPSGSQTAPSPDAGWTALYIVTVANGATTITSGNITPVVNAPFIVKNGYLPQIPFGVQQQNWIYANDVSATPNQIVISLIPPLQAYNAGVYVVIKLNNQITGATQVNINGLGFVSIVHGDGSPLSYGDGNAGQLMAISHDGVRFQRAWVSGTDIIDQNITFTVHGTTPNFVDLNAAFEYLSKFKITQNGSVTLQLAALNGASAYTYNALMTVDHPNADRIIVQGANLTATLTSSMFANTGYANRAADRATTLTNLRTVYPTEIKISGSNYFLIQNGFTLKNVLITGDRTGTNPLLAAYGGALFYTVNVSIVNSGNHGINVGPGAGLYSTGFLTTTGCAGSGIVASYGGSIYATGGATSFVLSNCNDGHGFWCNIGNFGADGYVNVGSWSNAGAGVISSTGNFSVVGTPGTPVIISNNGAHGIVAQYNGNAVFLGTTLSNNVGYGAIASDGGFIITVNPTGAGNTVGAILAQLGSFIDVYTNGMGGTVSPTALSVGNNNSYIKG